MRLIIKIFTTLFWAVRWHSTRLYMLIFWSKERRKFHDEISKTLLENFVGKPLNDETKEQIKDQIDALVSGYRIQRKRSQYQSEECPHWDSMWDYWIESDDQLKNRMKERMKS